MWGRSAELTPAPSSSTLIVPALARSLISPPRLECFIALLRRTKSTSCSHSGSARTQEAPSPSILSLSPPLSASGSITSAACCPAALGEDVIQEAAPRGRVCILPSRQEFRSTHDGHSRCSELVGGVGQKPLL